MAACSSTTTSASVRTRQSASVPAVGASTKRACHVEQPRWSKSRTQIRALPPALLPAVNSVRASHLPPSPHDIQRSVVQKVFLPQPRPEDRQRKDSSGHEPFGERPRAEHRLSPSGPPAPPREKLQRRSWRQCTDRCADVSVETRRLSSMPASQQALDHITESGELARNSPAQQEAVAVVIQAETTGKAKGPVGGKIPRNRGRKVV